MTAMTAMTAPAHVNARWSDFTWSFPQASQASLNINQSRSDFNSVSRYGGNHQQKVSILHN